MGESDQSDQLSEFVRDEIPSMLRFAVRLTGDVHTAEDVLQEALLRAARSISTYRGEATFRSWLTRIVINVFRSQVAASRPMESLEEDRHFGKADSAEQLSELTETKDLMHELINALPARQKEVLVLMTWEDLTANETADLLGISTQNVYSNLSAARSRLKQELGRLQTEDDPHHG